MGLDVILGIKIIWKESEIILTPHYIEKVLRKFDHFDCKSVSTPFDLSVRLYSNKGWVVSQWEYARVIGCLMHLMTSTRPDVAFAVEN